MKKILLICTFLTVLICTMTSCSHEHQWSEWQVSKAATCTQDGINIRVCDDCGESQSIPVSALGHNYSEWITTKEVSCTQDGLKERTCSCGEKEIDTIVASHAWKDATCTEAKNCSKCGLTDGVALGHTCLIGMCTRCSTTIYPTVNLPSTPMTVWYFERCSMEITELSYKFGSSGNLIISFSGEMTYEKNPDRLGDQLSDPFLGFKYKVFDKDGYVLATGSWTSGGYNVGDKFKNENLEVLHSSELNGSSEYTIVITDYKFGNE